jgi:dihydrofolate reductase
MISIIVAASTNMVIGNNGDLPWNLPSDLKYFKKVTDGKRVIMGRNTWYSIPEKFRPLPNRENIVVSKSNSGIELEGALVFNDLDVLLKTFSESDEETFVIGGAQIYKEAFKYADKLYLTQIYSHIEGDAYLEGLDPIEWSLISSGDMKVENNFKFKFEVYRKKVVI